MTSAPSPFDAFDLPPPWPESLLAGIRESNAARSSRIVVLDDDPLGGQCVHDVPVLMTWDPEALAQELDQSEACLLLTNTRALAHSDAIERVREVAAALSEAQALTGKPVVPVWRSDSTLRGHFWHEMAAYAGAHGDATTRPVYVFLPYFGDGGRYTLNDTQYLLQDGALLPVAESEFARDPRYAYRHSRLPDWIEAHTAGALPASEVLSIGLSDLRLQGPAWVAKGLALAPEGSAVIVNAADDRDLEVFVAGLQLAEAAGRNFLCSGAASFIRVRAGIDVCPPLRPDQLSLTPGTGGLTIAGSYVDRTTSQLACALAQPGVTEVELSIEALSEPEQRQIEHERVALRVSALLAGREDVILQTSREYVDGAAGLVEDAIGAVIERLHVRPRYLLAKGGSTASHLASACLGVRRAVVLGQLLPGVPVWRLGEECRWPGLPFVIFAGNVGTTESLAEALHILRGS